MTANALTDRWSDISAFDRDTFRGSVPKPLVALVGAVTGGKGTQKRVGTS